MRIGFSQRRTAGYLRHLQAIRLKAPPPDDDQEEAVEQVVTAGRR
jgi:hypothetical protein